MRFCLWLVAFVFLGLGIFGGFVQAAKMGDAVTGASYAGGEAAALYSDAERIAYEMKKDMHNFLSISCFLLGVATFFLFGWLAEIYAVGKLLKKSLIAEQNST